MPPKRPLRAASLLLAGLVACSPAFVPPTDAIPQQDVHPMTAALTVVSVRQTVVNFLEGYAHADQDAGKLLQASVALAPLQEWARWIQVQNDNREGTLQGKATIRNVQVIGPPSQATTGDRYLMEVDATVRFVVGGPGVKPQSFERRFLGQALVVRTPSGGWGVADIIRDGQQLGLEIHILPKTIVTSKNGLKVRAESVFTFGSTWVVNLVIDNQSDSSLAVVPNLTWIRVGTVLAKAETLDNKLQQPIQPGDTVMTQISAQPGANVPTQALLQIAFVTPKRTLLSGRLVLPFGPQGGPSGPTGGPTGPTGGATGPGAGT